MKKVIWLFCFIAIFVSVFGLHQYQNPDQSADLNVGAYNPNSVLPSQAPRDYSLVNVAPELKSINWVFPSNNNIDFNTDGNLLLTIDKKNSRITLSLANDLNITVTGDSNNAIYWNGQALPALLAGYFLTNNGTTLSWAQIVQSIDTNWQTSYPLFDANMALRYVKQSDGNIWYVKVSDSNNVSWLKSKTIANWNGIASLLQKTIADANNFGWLKITSIADINSTSAINSVAIRDLNKTHVSQIDANRWFVKYSGGITMPTVASQTNKFLQTNGTTLLWTTALTAEADTLATVTARGNTTTTDINTTKTVKAQALQGTTTVTYVDFNSDTDSFYLHSQSDVNFGSPTFAYSKTKIDGNVMPDGEISPSGLTAYWKMDYPVADSFSVGAATASGIINCGSSSLSYLGDFTSHVHYIRVYAYKTIEGINVYTTDYISANVDDSSCDQQYTIDWSFDSVSGADGYLLLKADSTFCGYNYDYYFVETTQLNMYDEHCGIWQSSPPAIIVATVEQDQSGYGYNAVYTSSVSNTASGLWDTNAFQNNGSSNFLSAANTDLTQGSFTVMAWIKFNSLTGDNPFFGICNSAASTCETTNQSLHLLGRNNDGHYRLWFGLYNNDMQGTATIKTNQWYHVAFVMQDGYKHIYLDGAIDDNTLYGNPGPQNFTGWGRTRIGAAQWSANPVYFDGTIDEVKVYNSALSQEQIIADYNSFMQAKYTSRVFDANIVSQWNTFAWKEKTDVNNGVTIDYRSCDDSVCSGESFITGLSGAGSKTISPPANRYFQFRVNLDTNSQSWNARASTLLYSYASDFNVSYKKVTTWITSGNAIRLDSDVNGNKKNIIDLNYLIANNIIDLTPAWTGTTKEALDAIIKITSKPSATANRDVNHESYPEFAQAKFPVVTYKTVNGKVTQQIDYIEGRGVGATTTLLIETIKELKTEINDLNSTLLKICKNNPLLCK